MSSRKIIAPLVFCICLGWQSLSHGATYISYLLVQGPFGPSHETETQKLEVIYDAGRLTTGQDLLNAVFGGPVAQPYPDDQISIAGDATFGATYLYGTSYFVNAFNLHGTQVADEFNPSWFNYASGGGYFSDLFPPPISGSYDANSWTLSATGQTDRLLRYNDYTGATYDAWVFS
ncbi:MAG: hypothetical protein K8R87_11975, partial [Verrucomicrobia bacterium]|nr:hypothetical protein [Verrucomicrobiota bacterium]